MVSDDAALDAIASGADGLIAGLSTGKVYVDMSTVSPEVSVDLAARVRAKGAEMLDAPVSGSVPQAETGTLTIMVGGDEPRLRACPNRYLPNSATRWCTSAEMARA